MDCRIFRFRNRCSIQYLEHKLFSHNLPLTSGFRQEDARHDSANSEFFFIKT